MWLRFSSITFLVCLLFFRRWGQSVQSGWILHFYLSESQTWAQHGSNWWEPPFSSIIHTNLYCMTSVAFIRWLSMFVFCFCFLEYHTYCFCVLIHSKWVSSDSRENCDLQHDPQCWALHSHPNRPQWVQHNCFIFFVCVLLRTTESIFFALSLVC